MKSAAAVLPRERFVEGHSHSGGASVAQWERVLQLMWGATPDAELVAEIRVLCLVHREALSDSIAVHSLFGQANI